MKEYKDSLKYVESFINYEKKKKFSYKEAMDLERVKNLFKKCQVDTTKIKIIHVAGTNGKGSVTEFISNILARQGFKVGVYTSPHLYDIRERIKITEKRKSYSQLVTNLISSKEFSAITRDIRSVLEKEDKSSEISKTTFFEILTALAYKYFLIQKVDFAVVECGLGGRLDATNVQVPELSVITRIGYDHCQFLGKDIADIAFEKAGIIKEHVPCIAADKDDPVYRTLKDKADSLSSPLYVYNKEFKAEDIKIGKKETVFDFVWAQGELRDISLFIKGDYQVENASLSIFAFLLLKDKYSLKVDSLKQGLKDTFIQGRFEQFKYRNSLFIFDVAHNPQSIKALNKNIKDYFPKKKVILVFGCSGDKNYLEMLKLIDYNKLIITKSKNIRSIMGQKIKKDTGLTDCVIENDSGKAIELAERLQRENDIIAVTGSAFLVAEIKERYRLMNQGIVNEKENRCLS